MKLHPFSIFGPSIFSGVIQEDILKTPLPFPDQRINQVHGTDVLYVDHYSEHTATYDAMVSDKSALKLMIKTADCIPLVFADEQAGVIGAAHAGWRSLVAEIIPKTIDEMVKLGASRNKILVGMGPSLGTCCSEFSQPYEEIPEKYHWAILENNHVDLLNIAHQQVMDSGIPGSHVERMAICTACSPEWFSWRRNHSNERMGTFIEKIM